MMAPGTRALAFASRWFDPATVQRTFEPLIADWQRERQDTRPSRRAWASFRGFMAFVCAVAISSPVSVFLYKDAGGPVWRFCFAKQEETLRSAAERLLQV